MSWLFIFPPPLPLPVKHSAATRSVCPSRGGWKAIIHESAPPLLAGYVMHASRLSSLHVHVTISTRSYRLIVALRGKLLRAETLFLLSPFLFPSFSLPPSSLFLRFEFFPAGGAKITTKSSSRRRSSLFSPLCHPFPLHPRLPPPLSRRHRRGRSTHRETGNNRKSFHFSRFKGRRIIIKSN